MTMSSRRTTRSWTRRRNSSSRHAGREGWPDGVRPPLVSSPRRACRRPFVRGRGRHRRLRNAADRPTPPAQLLSNHPLARTSPHTPGTSSAHMNGSARLLVIAGAGVLLLAGVGAGVLLTPPERVTVPVLDAPNRPPVVQNVASVRRASELSDAFISIAETVTPAVVRIQAERTVPHPRTGWLPR